MQNFNENQQIWIGLLNVEANVIYRALITYRSKIENIKDALILNKFDDANIPSLKIATFQIMVTNDILRQLDLFYKIDTQYLLPKK